MFRFHAQAAGGAWLPALVLASSEGTDHACKADQDRGGSDTFTLQPGRVSIHLLYYAV